MIKVITYGSFDMLHYGHIRLLERAKALGDYLIVGITSDDYDKTRGKINLQQSLTERLEAVRKTGLADSIIIEEYEGQKIDDIQRLDVDIFTVGSDWVGYFDYLKQYCKVVYLPRTEGISSSDLRAKQRRLRIGLIGDDESRVLNKYCAECKFVNGAEVSGVCTKDIEVLTEHKDVPIVGSFEELLDVSDAVYIISKPEQHYGHIRMAIEHGKHALVELPFTLDEKEFREVVGMARDRDVILMPAMKTAYSTAYNRCLLIAKSGKIGKIVSVDATCTSIRDFVKENRTFQQAWNSICAWGPTALLPVFQLLGDDYKAKHAASLFWDNENRFDAFSKVDFTYASAVASIKVGRGVKSEGELVITGTEGYIYVPAPWWKTDYFEVRYENPANNRRYFYQLDGEGIRYEIVAFMKAIASGKNVPYISDEISLAITKVISDFYLGKVYTLQ